MEEAHRLEHQWRHIHTHTHSLILFWFHSLIVKVTLNTWQKTLAQTWLDPKLAPSKTENKTVRSSALTTSYMDTEGGAHKNTNTHNHTHTTPYASTQALYTKTSSQFFCLFHTALAPTEQQQQPSWLACEDCNFPPHFPCCLLALSLVPWR